MMSAVTTLQNKKDFDDFIGDSSLSVVHFGATWVDVCAQLDSILVELQNELKSFKFARLEAEGVADASLAFSVKAAPTVLFFKSGKEIGRVNGFSPSEIKATILKHSNDLASGTENETSNGKEELNQRLKALINKSRLMIFIKGTPEAPKCGFTRRALELLRSVNADFSSFDILSDEQVRQGLKEYSNWPTYPQIYLDGELIGGVDVFSEEMTDKKFVEKLPKLTVE